MVNDWRDEFVEYRDNALRDPEVRAAYDSADAGLAPTHPQPRPPQHNNTDPYIPGANGTHYHRCYETYCDAWEDWAHS